MNFSAWFHSKKRHVHESLVLVLVAPLAVISSYCMSSPQAVASLSATDI
jgi:hypothetical protein